MIRENRTKKSPLNSIKEMKKQSLTAYNYKFDKTNELLFVRWKDKM